MTQLDAMKRTVAQWTEIMRLANKMKDDAEFSIHDIKIEALANIGQERQLLYNCYLCDYAEKNAGKHRIRPYCEALCPMYKKWPVVYPFMPRVKRAHCHDLGSAYFLLERRDIFKDHHILVKKARPLVKRILAAMEKQLKRMEKTQEN